MSENNIDQSSYEKTINNDNSIVTFKSQTDNGKKASIIAIEDTYQDEVNKSKEVNINNRNYKKLNERIDTNDYNSKSSRAGFK